MHIYTIMLNVDQETNVVSKVPGIKVYNFCQFLLLVFKNSFKSVCVTRVSISQNTTLFTRLKDQQHNFLFSFSVHKPTYQCWAQQSVYYLLCELQEILVATILAFTQTGNFCCCTVCRCSDVGSGVGAVVASVRRGWGCPVPDTAGVSWPNQPTTGHSRDPQPGWWSFGENVSKKGQKNQTVRGGGKKTAQETQGQKRRRMCCSMEQISTLQPTEDTMPEQLDIPAACRDPMLEQKVSMKEKSSR